MPQPPSPVPRRPRASEGRAHPPDPREAVLPLVPDLRAFARALARDPHEAEDLVQDALMLALRAWDRFTPGTNLKAWLLTILRNRFYTVRGRRHVTAEIGVDDLERVASVPAVQERGAELRGFVAAFARLGPAHREVLVLAGVHGLSYERIAEVVGCPSGTVRSRMNRAREALGRMLTEDGSSPAGRGRPLPRGRRLPAREGESDGGEHRGRRAAG